MENYPDLKANQNVLSLQEELSTTENQISFSRQHYNATVRDYNTAIASVPAVFIAGMFGFGERDFFEAEERSEEHTSELQSLMRISYAVFCLKKKTEEHY